MDFLRITLFLKFVILGLGFSPAYASLFQPKTYDLSNGMKVIVIPEINTQPEWMYNAHYNYTSLSKINWEDHIS